MHRNEKSLRSHTSCGGFFHAGRKPYPTFRAKMGCRFPLDPLRETASHFKGVNRDVISPNDTFGKPHPTLDAQNGMSFPMVIQDQKHVR